MVWGVDEREVVRGRRDRGVILFFWWAKMGGGDRCLMGVFEIPISSLFSWFIGGFALSLLVDSTSSSTLFFFHRVSLSD